MLDIRKIRENPDAVKALFEGASRYEFNRSGFFDIAASAKCLQKDL